MPKKYQTLVADPPWAFGDKLPGKSRGAAKNYNVLGGDAIMMFTTTEKMGRRSIEDAIAPDARLFLWRVAAMQEEALSVVRAWGFELKAELVWIKTGRPCASCRGVGFKSQTKIIIGSRVTRESSDELWCHDCQGRGSKLHFGMGRQTRASHETCLIATRGRPERLSASVRSVFEAQTGIHSEKPEAFYRLVEELSPGPYLELFARRGRKGWTNLGREGIIKPGQKIGG